MKIKKLKLVNFIGIKHGTGLDEIEIDFSKSTQKLIGIFGGNGSGKTTILSSLHPYKESFDERKSLILDGKEGRKEITIESNGHTYEIVHIYSKSAQSFIKKDGVELNENGGVRTFEEIVSKELGITKEYFLIGKIGSNSKNFIDLTTSERKTYIGTFLNIESILEKYRIVNDKFKALKKNIGSIATNLSKYSEPAIVQEQIEKKKENLSSIETSLSSLYREDGAVSSKLKTLTEKLSLFKGEELERKIEEKQQDISTNQEIKRNLEPLFKDFLSEIDSKKESIESEILSLEKEISSLESSEREKSNLLTSENNKLTTKRIELSSLGNPEDLKEVTEELSSVSEKKNNLLESIKNSKCGKIINNGIKLKLPIEKYINNFRKFVNFIQKYYNELNSNSFIPSKRNIETFLDETFENSLNHQVNLLKKTLKDREAILALKQKEVGVEESFLSQLENLSKRPEECTFNSCLFIKEAYEHKNAPENIAALEENIKEIKKDIEDLNTKLENFQLLNTLYISFVNELSNVEPRENILYCEFFKEKSLLNYFLNENVAIFQQESNALIEDASSVYLSLIEYLNLANKENLLSKSKKVLEDSDSSSRGKYEKEISEKENEISELKESLRVIKENLQNANTKIVEKRKLLSNIEVYLQANSKLLSAQTMLSNANSEYKEFKTISEEYSEAILQQSEISAQIKTFEEEKASIRTEITSLETMLNKINELNTELKELNEKYSVLETITNSLSPTTGIPLVFIKAYLGETEQIANELLELAFGADFKIAFVTTEKEFAIQVKCKDSIKADIKLASQGEVSITTLSISLALIEQSLKEYNILTLDEIDGALDFENRYRFTEILEQQINKLGIEQAFIISHNNAFEMAPMDLILLEGNSLDIENPEFMKNKTVLFNLKE